MSTAWFLLSILGPIAAALLGGLVLRPVEPGPRLAVALNAMMPGSGLAALGRPLVEVVLCTLFAIVSLLVVGRFEDLWMWGPIMVVGGLWALVHTPLSPLAADTSKVVLTELLVDPNATARRLDRPARPSRERDQEAGYSIAVRCTECGADVEVPVLHRMACCGYCGTNHLVVGHESTLLVAIPEKITDADGLRDAVLDHYRYQRYLTLYKRHVAPLERSVTGVSETGELVVGSDLEGAAAAAEEAVSRRADAYRKRLADELELGRTTRFLAPYRHGMGTLYQAAFGRSFNDREKRLEFAVGTIEGSTPASTAAELPDMGKLSYLRALVPAAELGPEAAALPADRGEETLRSAYGVLDRKRLVRDLDVIRLGIAFVEEVTALIWRPWWIVEARTGKRAETLLVDGGAGSVAGNAPVLDPAALGALPSDAIEQGSGLGFLPMQCPTCGDDFPFEAGAVVHFCRNCHRTFAVTGKRKRELAYDHLAPAPGADADLVPYWRYPLRLRTGDGSLVTDLPHLRDGIDGNLDQIGEAAPAGHDTLLVPAVRCINPHLTARALTNLLRFAIAARPSLAKGRLPLDLDLRPWAVTVSEAEARRFAPLSLATVFSRRDLARVNVHQVTSWLFDARLETEGRLCYLPVPRALTEPFRAYVGRFRAAAVERAVEG